MTLNLAFLAQGKLYYQAGDAPPRLLESPFAQQVLERTVRTSQRNEWKTKGPGAGFMTGGMLWGANEVDPAARRIEVTAVARGAPGQLLYVLSTDTVSGLFAYDLSSGEERRLLHKKEFSAGHLARHPTRDLVACSLVYGNGVANLGVMQADGGRLREITEGDSRDEAPCWAPGDREVLYYQTAGIARDPQGYQVAFGPYSIQRLDLDRGTMDTVCEDERTDYLTPRVGADEALYYLRRPYQGRRAGATPLRMLGDAALFPFRLTRAVVARLNIFSLMWSGKPLTTAGGPKQEGPDAKQLMLWGRMVRAQQAQHAGAERGARPLRTADWRLVRQRAGGGAEVLAERVLGFDLEGAGGVCYTDGTTIYHRDAGGRVQTVGRGEWIAQVVAV